MDITQLLCTGAIVAGAASLYRIRNMRHPRRVHAAQSVTGAPGINYAGNPYRVGAYVYVMELDEPSNDDWQGTYIGMQDGMAMVRDTATHVVAHVNKDQLYSATR